MPKRAKTFQAAVVSLAALLPACVHAEGIDTEHLFGFMIGTDVGNVGEREFQSETTGRFGKNGGTLSGRRPGVRTGVCACPEFSN